jgi:hypothetical protein
MVLLSVDMAFSPSTRNWSQGQVQDVVEVKKGTGIDPYLATTLVNTDAGSPARLITVPGDLESPCAQARQHISIAPQPVCLSILYPSHLVTSLHTWQVDPRHRVCGADENAALGGGRSHALRPALQTPVAGGRLFQCCTPLFTCNPWHMAGGPRRGVSGAVKSVTRGGGRPHGLRPAPAHCASRSSGGGRGSRANPCGLLYFPVDGTSLIPRFSLQVDPDAESLARLKALRGEVDAPMRSAPPLRTAQVELAEAEAAERAAADGAERPADDRPAPPAAEPAGDARQGNNDDDDDLQIGGAKPLCCFPSSLDSGDRVRSLSAMCCFVCKLRLDCRDD